MELSSTGATELEAIKPLIQMAYDGQSGTMVQAVTSLG